MIHNILPVCRRRSCKQESHMKQLQNKSNTHIPPSARGEVKRNNSIYIQKGLLLFIQSVCLSVCLCTTTHNSLGSVYCPLVGYWILLLLALLLLLHLLIFKGSWTMTTCGSGGRCNNVSRTENERIWNNKER